MYFGEVVRHGTQQEGDDPSEEEQDWKRGSAGLYSSGRWEYVNRAMIVRHGLGRFAFDCHRMSLELLCSLLLDGCLFQLFRFILPTN